MAGYHRPMRIRLAEPDDIEAIRAIYNAEVTESIVTFDIVPWTARRPAAWLERHRGAHPAVVAVDEPGVADELIGARGEPVLGFGSLSPFRDRPAYATTVEDSVYVARHARRRRGRPGPPRGADPAGRRPRLPRGHRPDRGREHRLDRPAPRRAGSSSSGSSARSGASTAGGSTWSSCSGCSEALSPSASCGRGRRRRPTVDRRRRLAAATSVDHRPSGHEQHAQEHDEGERDRQRVGVDQLVDAASGRRAGR